MEIKSKLKTDIPKIVYDVKQIKDLLDAIQPEIDAINAFLYKTRYDLHISTTTIIERFERDYGITPDESKTLEKRIAAVLEKKNAKIAFTEERLRQTIINNYGDDYELNEDWAHYAFTIIVNDPEKSISDLSKAIHTYKPAHLYSLIALLLGVDKIKINDQTIIISNLVRYCGNATFRAGVDPL